MLGRERVFREKEPAVYHQEQKVFLAGKEVLTWGVVGEEEEEVEVVRAPLLVSNSRDELLAQVPQNSTTTINNLPTTPTSYQLR